MKFKNKLSLLKRNTEVREIAGQSFTFYPISVRMLFELKSNMEPLMKALRSLFTKTDDQLGTQTVEETKDPSMFDRTAPAANTVSRVTHIGAPDLSILKAREEQRQAELQASIEALLGDQNRLMLGRVLADSLRDEGIRTDDDVLAFVTDEAFDLPILVEMLGGFFAVNAKVFGPFAQRVRSMVKDKMANLTRSQESASDSASPEVDPASLNPFGSVEPSPS